MRNKWIEKIFFYESSSFSQRRCTKYFLFLIVNEYFFNISQIYQTT